MNVENANACFARNQHHIYMMTFHTFQFKIHFDKHAIPRCSFSVDSGGNYKALVVGQVKGL